MLKAQSSRDIDLLQHITDYVTLQDNHRPLSFFQNSTTNSFIRSNIDIITEDLGREGYRPFHQLIDFYGVKEGISGAQVLDAMRYDVLCDRLLLAPGKHYFKLNNDAALSATQQDAVIRDVWTEELLAGLKDEADEKRRVVNYMLATSMIDGRLAEDMTAVFPRHIDCNEEPLSLTYPPSARDEVKAYIHNNQMVSMIYLKTITARMEDDFFETGENQPSDAVIEDYNIFQERLKTDQNLLRRQELTNKFGDLKNITQFSGGPLPSHTRLYGGLYL